MAGHSQFKNIMHRKGAQDVKRAKMFNKLAREITVAAKSGLPDPAMNPPATGVLQGGNGHLVRHASWRWRRSQYCPAAASAIGTETNATCGR